MINNILCGFQFFQKYYISNSRKLENEKKLLFLVSSELDGSQQ